MREATTCVASVPTVPHLHAPHVRRLRRMALVDSLSPVLPPRTRMASTDSSHRPTLGEVGPPHPYGAGPDRLRYVPGAISGFGGTSFLLGLVRTDPVGRLGGVVIGVGGAAALPSGLAARLETRFSRNELRLDGWVSHEAPSREFEPAYDAGLDLSRFGGALRVHRMIALDGGELSYDLGGIMEHQLPSGQASTTRTAGVLDVGLTRRQRDLDAQYVERFDLLAEAGNTDSGAYLRQRSTLMIGAGSNSGSLVEARVMYGTVGGGNGTWQERYAIGGFSSPLIDRSLDARRVDAPAYPVGASLGTSFSSYRVSLPVAPLELFYAGASPDFFRTSLRSYGAEYTLHVPQYSVLGTPELDILAGFARAVDYPVTGDWRYYLSMSVHP